MSVGKPLCVPSFIYSHLFANGTDGQRVRYSYRWLRVAAKRGTHTRKTYVQTAGPSLVAVCVTEVIDAKDHTGRVRGQGTRRDRDTDEARQGH